MTTLLVLRAGFFNRQELEGLTQENPVISTFTNKQRI
jgi:hypothetical protein